MQNILSFLRKKYVIYGAVIILGTGLVFTLLKNGDVKKETLVVHPSNFVQQVSVSGKVTAAQEVDLGFSQSGRVSRVYVKVGDTVKTGSLLAEVENGDLRSVVMQKQAVLESQEAKLQSLKEGTRPEELAVSQTAVDSAASDLAQANQEVVDAIADSYTKSDDAVRNKVDQFMNNPSSNPQLIFLINDLQVARNVEFKRLVVEDVLKEWSSENIGLSASSDTLVAGAKAQKNLAAISALLADASAALSEANPSGTVTESDISGYITDIATARITINTAISILSTKIGAQKSAALALDSARRTLELKQAGSTQSDINVQSAQVKSAKADLGNAQAQLAKTLIFAPFAGVITKVEAKAGQIVSPNIPEVSMIGSGAFQVESYVPEINVGLIKINHEAIVTLDAFGSEAPFNAKVVSIDPAETLRDGVSTYRTILQFEAQDQRIKSGMTANILITTEKKSGVISVPQKIVITTEEGKFVKVKEGENFVERKVETGSVSSLGQIEITSGLKDGDVVVLEQSAASVGAK